MVYRGTRGTRPSVKGSNFYRMKSRSYSGNRRAYQAKRRGTSIASAVRSVLNGRTGGFVGLETKFFDSSFAGGLSASTDASGGEVDPDNLLCLNCPAQGDGETQRDGRQISMDSLTVKGLVTVAAQTNQTAADVVPDIFIAIVLDKQTNGAQLDSELVFENPSGASNLGSMPFRNLEWTKRFRVLKTMKVSAHQFAGAVIPAFDGTNIEQQGVAIPFSCHIKLNGMKVNFISGQTSSVIAAIADNSIHVIAYTNGVSLAPVINYNARLRFKG